MPVIFPLKSRKFYAIYLGCFSNMGRVLTIQCLDFFYLWHHQCPRHQHQRVDGLAQDCSIFSALAMGILHSCTKPYNYIQNHWPMMHVCIPSLIMLFQFIFNLQSLRPKGCRHLRLSVHLSVRPPVRPSVPIILVNLPNLQSGSSMALLRMV